MLLIESLGTAEKGPVVDVSTTLQGILSAFLGGGVVCVCVLQVLFVVSSDLFKNPERFRRLTLLIFREGAGRIPLDSLKCCRCRRCYSFITLWGLARGFF